MKKITTIIFLILSMQGYSQVQTVQVASSGGTSGSTFNPDTLEAAIALKANISDTASLLATQARVVNGLALKLNISDTASMLLDKWGKRGNVVTSGSDFLGSTNNASLRFRVNNIERMVLDSTGYIGITNYGTAIQKTGQPNLKITTDFLSSGGLGFYSLLNIGFLITNVEKMRMTTTGNLLINTTTDIGSSKLTVASTTQGVLLPRMTTTQKTAIASPVEGLEVYDLTLHQKSYYNGTVWINY